MQDYTLDDVDQQLIEMLQEDARYTAIELAEAIGVSDNTIHNRMDRLESEGVITGYDAAIDQDRIGLGLFISMICTARISDRSEVADKAIEIPQVVEVTELMTGERNIHVKAVGAEDEDITRVAERVNELALEINDENLIRAERTSGLDFDGMASVLAKVK